MRLLVRLCVLFGLGWFAYLLLRENHDAVESVPKSNELERRLAALEQPGAPPSAKTFSTALAELLEERKSDKPFVDVNAGALHRNVGGYPGPNHRMPTCCAAMRAALKRGDMVLKEPRSGVGASLTLRYHLA
jgi:hypothetical protein